MSGPTHPSFEASRTAVGFLRAFAVMAFVTVALHLSSRFLPDGLKFLEPLAFVLLALIQLMTIYAFASWFKAAYANLGRLGAETQYTPAMAVVVFFVPFSNLFKPTQLVRELYAGSDPARLRPNSKRRPDTSHAATFWWYGFLTSSIVGDIAAALTLREQEIVRLAATSLMVLSLIIAAASALGATRFVLDIRELQRRCALLLRIDKKITQSAAIEDDSFHTSKALSANLRFFLIISAVLQPVFVGLVWMLPSKPDLAVSAGLAALIWIVVALAAGITFLCWVYRIVTNMRRALPFSTKPGSAVIGFFIPIINIIHAWDLLQSIWKFLDRVGAGIWHYDARSVALTKKEGSRSAAIDIWWLTNLANIGIAIFTRVVEPGENARLYLVAELLLSVVSSVLIVQVVAAISRKMNSIEQFLLAQRATPAILPAPVPATEAATPSASATPAAPAIAVQKRSWSEVLLPIAATIDDGVRADPVEERLQRERVETAKDLEKEKERLRRIEIEKSTFRNATQLTSTVRVLLLLAIFVGAGEAFVLVSFAPRIQSTVVVLLLICFAALPCGLPAWVMLSRWAYAQWRNAVSLALVDGDPSAAARKILLFNEPFVMRDLLIAATQSAEVGTSFRIWQLALRLLQFSPIYLAYGATKGDLSVMVAAGVFMVALVICLTFTAGLVRQIDGGLASMYRAAGEDLMPLPVAAVAAGSPLSPQPLPELPPS